MIFWPKGKNLKRHTPIPKTITTTNTMKQLKKKKVDTLTRKAERHTITRTKKEKKVTITPIKMGTATIMVTRMVKKKSKAPASGRIRELLKQMMKLALDSHQKRSKILI